MTSILLINYQYTEHKRFFYALYTGSLFAMYRVVHPCMYFFSLYCGFVLYILGTLYGYCLSTTKITKIIDMFINIIPIIIIIIIVVIIILWLTGHSYHRTFEVCLQRRRIF